MAKDKSLKKDKKDKSSKSDSLAKQSTDGISKEKTKSKSSKKDKSGSGSASKSISPESADRLLKEISNGASSAAMSTLVVAGQQKDVDAEVDGEGDQIMGVESSGGRAIDVDRPRGALVPFANPLADEKTAKKVFKSVKKANKSRALKRGVKEVVKTLRKSPLATPSSSKTPSAVVVIAADISPMDVISHLPVLCEDHGVPYVYVSSRAELGAAGMTKRPTSVVLVGKEGSKRKGKDKDGEKEDKDKEGDWDEVYADLVKVVRKAGRDVRI